MAELGQSPDEVAARLAAILDASDDAIIGETVEGIITSWNRGAERIFGYTAREAIGQPITLIIPPERLAEEHKRFWGGSAAGSGSSTSRPYGCPRRAADSTSP